MAKGTGGHYKHPHRAQWHSVQLPADAGVQKLLLGTGTRHEGLFSEMASRADPGWRAQRAVTLPAEKVPMLAEEIAVVLRRAREAADPAADALASVAAQFGVTEVVLAGTATQLGIVEAPAAPTPAAAADITLT